MDSKHRHELKTNELADWVAHIPVFLRRNWAQIVGAALIIIGLLVVPIFKRTRHNAALTRQAETTQLIQKISQEKALAVRNQSTGILEAQSQLLVVASSLESAAGKAGNPYSAALALIKRAEALRADLHYQAGSVERSTVQAQINQATKAYEQAIEKAAGNNMLTGMAKMGLGLCAEELGDLDKADRIYHEIMSNADFDGTIFPAQAQLRLEAMDDSKEKFVFVDAPEPETPAVEIEIPIETGDETAGEIIGPLPPLSSDGETDEAETTPQDTGTSESAPETEPSAEATSDKSRAAQAAESESD